MSNRLDLYTQETLDRFIVIEGQDGAGKTVQSKILGDRIKHHGFDVCSYKEPDDKTFIGRMLREKILTGSESTSLTAERLLYAASRFENVGGIRMGLKSNKNLFVVSDRYIMSSLVYQNDISDFEGSCCQIYDINPRIQPGMVILLATNPEDCYKRVMARGGKRSVHELKKQQFVDRNELYHQVFEMEKKSFPNTKYFSIYGSHSVDKVSNLIWEVVKEHYNIS